MLRIGSLTRDYSWRVARVSMILNSEKTWVPLDKDEGFVKAQLSCAVREHRLSFQRG